MFFNQENVDFFLATFRNVLNQIHANLLKNHIPPNIEQAKYSTFTVISPLSEGAYLWGIRQ